MKAKRRPAKYPSSPIRPLPWDYANRHIMLPFRGGARSVDLLEPSERAIDPNLINRAVEIIAPDKTDESSCHCSVVYRIWAARDGNHCITDTVVDKKKILARLKGSLQKAKRSIAALPLPLRDDLFFLDFEAMQLKRTQLKRRYTNGPFSDPYSDFFAELNTLVRRIDHSAEYSGRKIDTKKWNAAAAARDLMREFGRTPTKTVEGPFYQLASILYEAINGVGEVNLNRQCRGVLRRQ
jgi:hypothetical protein